MRAKIFNTIITPNVESNVKIPGNTKRILIKTREGSDDLKLAYEQGQSAITYVNIPAGSTKVVDSTNQSSLSDVVLYFQSPTGQTVEVECWNDV